MKRNLVIAAVTAAALVGGGTFTAVAVGGEGRDDDGGTARTAPPSPVTVPGVTDPSADDRSGTTPTAVTASEAAAAALRKYPGAVSSVDRDDDRGSVWEVEVLGVDGRWREVRIDAAGTVRPDDRRDDGRHDDGDDDRENRDERAALRAATVDAQEAAAAALASVPGTVTSVDLDDDFASAWDVGVRGKDGRTHELTVHTKSGQVAPARTTDDRHDRDDDDRHDDDRNDDHGGHGDDD
ncbi:PepSY domain-containing protein [Streptomyces sp. SID3212]|uniref:PepSY domain-containing protein n=1 Tax=Streptomyces sp. SID3212 TaxID=2690259 RepID=UPI001371E0BF|nr:PepSY domain-containing protein [Streptomyces sp. SID3212]MYV53778.1 peptidase M4 [Streptomyces sp. SID3212]